MKSYFQHNIVQQFFTAQRTSSRLSALLLLTAIVAISIPLQASAGATSNSQFQQYVTDICLGNITAPPGVTWNTSTMCTNATPGYAGGGVTVSTNLGTTDANTGSTTPKGNEVHECLDDFNQTPGEDGCATGGWGLLVSAQFGRSTRTETELENGFQSDLRGLLIGMDHRFTDNFILGAAVSRTQDEATFVNSAGSLKTSNSILTMYSTWLPSEKISVDGYLGYGIVNFDSQRKIVFGTLISGTASGSTLARQAMAGISTAYHSKLGNVSVSPFINLDYIKTDIKGYNETGTTLLELHYGDRSTISSTASLGARLSQSYPFKWGSLSPSLHGAGVHEFQNNANQIYSELVITPGAGIFVATDEPDRDYFLSGLGVTAALNSGTQLFLNYERRSGDSLLDSWAVSLGLLKEF
ncbi:MAG: autotransporter outer membrane beta-barrel domain-containing protein [Gallionellaceae bacterium]